VPPDLVRVADLMIPRLLIRLVQHLRDHNPRGKYHVMSALLDIGSAEVEKYPSNASIYVLLAFHYNLRSHLSEFKKQAYITCYILVNIHGINSNVCIRVVQKIKYAIKTKAPPKFFTFCTKTTVVKFQNDTATIKLCSITPHNLSIRSVCKMFVKKKTMPNEWC